LHYYTIRVISSFMFVDWYDFVWLAVYICFQIGLLVLPIRAINKHQLPTASTVVVVAEQVKLAFKTCKL
jgi:hypothetical protein